MLKDFLKTKRTQDELRTAFDVLMEFKGNESTEEWLSHPFPTWFKLEQYEGYLRQLLGEEE